MPRRHPDWTLPAGQARGAQGVHAPVPPGVGYEPTGQTRGGAVHLRGVTGTTALPQSIMQVEVVDGAGAAPMAPDGSPGHAPQTRSPAHTTRCPEAPTAPAHGAHCSRGEVEATTHPVDSKVTPKLLQSYLKCIAIEEPRGEPERAF